MSQPRPQAKTAPAFEKCPKCQLRPSTPGRNRWCAECNQEYQREYYGTRIDRLEGKGFSKGVEAMRQAIAEHFGQFRFAKFAGQEIEKLVASIPAPRFQEPEKPAQPEPAANGAAAPQP